MNLFRMILLTITIALVGTANASTDQDEASRRALSSSPSWSSTYTNNIIVNNEDVPTQQDELVVENSCFNNRTNTIALTGAVTGCLLLGGFAYYILWSCTSDPSSATNSLCSGLNSSRHASGHYW